MLIDIIGIVSVFLILFLVFTNSSLSKIILVLFASSIALFIARLTLTQQSTLDAFFNSFGLLSILAIILVTIHFLKKRLVTNKNR